MASKGRCCRTVQDVRPLLGCDESGSQVYNVQPLHSPHKGDIAARMLHGYAATSHRIHVQRQCHASYHNASDLASSGKDYGSAYDVARRMA